MFVVLLITAILVPTTDASAFDDWPHWRGENHDGISAEVGLDWSWPQDGPPILWQMNVGIGYSSIVVVGDALVATGHDVRLRQEVIVRLDAKTGERKWSVAQDAPLHNIQHKGGPASTPAIHGGLVYIVSKDGKVSCLSLKDGERIWQVNLQDRFGVKMPSWGFAGSPLIIDDRVILDVGRIVALDRKTGETLWQTEDAGIAYSSPIPFKKNGRSLVAVLPRAGLYIVDASQGEVVTSMPWETDNGVNASSAVFVEQNIFISTGYNTGCALLRWEGDELVPEWENRNMRNKVSSSIYMEGRLFGFDEVRLRCIDPKTGRAIWSKRGLGHGSLMGCDGKVVVVSEDGKLIVVDAKAPRYSEISSFQILETSDAWIPPVISGGLLYIRSSDGLLQCMDLRPEDK